MHADYQNLDNVRGMLTIEQFCREYSTGRTKTFYWLSTGRLRGVKAGSRTLIPRREAEEFVRSLPPARAT